MGLSDFDLAIQQISEFHAAEREDHDRKIDAWRQLGYWLRETDQLAGFLLPDPPTPHSPEGVALREGLRGERPQFMA